MLGNRWQQYGLVGCLGFLILGCAHPGMDYFQKYPTPMRVRVDGPQGLSALVFDEYEAALRARLATTTEVVVKGIKPPVGSSLLRVMIYERDTSGGVSPGVVGTATGIAVGALSLATGSRDALFDGLFWGIWSGTQAAAARREALRQRGYDPARLHVGVEVFNGIESRPLLTFQVGSEEILEAMNTVGSGVDENRQLEMEAKALARAVVSRLQEEMGWMTLPEPRWYEGARVAPLRYPMLP